MNTKVKGCGELQDQKWVNMEAEERHGEQHPRQFPMLPGRVQGAGGGCPGVLCLGGWDGRGVGTGPLATGFPPPHFAAAPSSW